MTKRNEKEKKQSLLWRATKASFRGVGSLLFGTAKFIGRKAGEAAHQRKLDKNPVYTSEAKIDNFDVVKQISGEYQSLENKLMNESIIALVFGKRGSGKSALGFKVLENIHAKTKRKCYVLGIKNTIMPKWITSVDNIDEVENSGAILVDEGAVSFSSRQSMSSNNINLTKLLAVARHKNLTILFITQNTGMIDKNILKLSDMLFVKQGSLLQLEMERGEIQKFYKKAEESFKDLNGEKKQYVYLIDSDFEGVISTSLPSFWTENISKNQSV